MRIEINIAKQLNNFPLSISLRSDAKRIGILGESGAGKSMTLKCIAGIENPDRGRIIIDGKTLYDSEQKISLTPQKRLAGYMFQNYALFPTMTVFENIKAGIREPSAKSSDRKESDSLVREFLVKFHIENLADVYPSKLSGGQKQRVALARMLIGNPGIIMLDEPFSALDATLRDRMQQELMAMLEDYEGCVIMVSHNRDEIYRFSDEIFILNDGKIIESGEKKEIFLNPHKKETARLTGCKNITKLIRIDERNAMVPEWDMKLQTERVIPDCDYIGYRAHDFELMYSYNTIKQSNGREAEPSNAINVRLKNIAELPFETNLYFEIDAEYYYDTSINTPPQICCFIGREEYYDIMNKEMPTVLGIKEDKILFLED